MATKKQLAALKKARAARKRNLAKTTRKRVGTSTTKKSMTTRKTPTKRLKKRRAKNTKKGYYPNPRKKSAVKYIVKLVVGKRSVYYVRPGVFETVRTKATALSESGAAGIARRLFKKYKALPSLRSVSTEKKKR